jgi:hypothetical protein
MNTGTYAEIWISTWLEIAAEIITRDYYRGEAMTVELCAMASAAGI